MASPLSGLPAFGVGLGFRREIAREILAHADAFDFLEVISDHYLDPTADETRELERLRARFPLVPHGLNLSVGTAGPFDDDYARAVGRLVARLGAPWWSDHLAMTRAGGIDIGHLAPIPFTREALDVVCTNVRQAQAAVPVPFVIEHIASPLVQPGAEMTEAAFVSAILERTGAGLLLDLMNVYANAWNHGSDPYAFLGGIPLDRVVYVHVIGGRFEDGVLVDSHSDRTPDVVWDMLGWVARRATLKGVVIEWDEGFPSFEILIEEAARAREVLACAV